MTAADNNAAPVTTMIEFHKAISIPFNLNGLRARGIRPDNEKFTYSLPVQNVLAWSYQNGVIRHDEEARENIGEPCPCLDNKHGEPQKPASQLHLAVPRACRAFREDCSKPICRLILADDRGGPQSSWYRCDLFHDSDHRRTSSWIRSAINV